MMEPDLTGKTLSHYKILEKLGEGGMGVVYLAEDTKLGRRIALKLLPAEWTRSSKARVRFLHEAQTAAALNHPNICTIHEVDDTDGQVFLAMEHIDGESLRERVERGPLTIGDIIAIALDVARGLSAAHEQGIVHRDIKPGNVMLTSDGRAKVLDFGLALAPERTRLTMEGRTTGTVSYMSPEQSRGEAVDRRTDIWSLGVMLYEMLTGQRPFAGEHEQAVIRAIVNDEPEPPTGLRTGIPLELERIIRKAMAKSPEDRYQHVDDLLVDLRSVRRESSEASRTVTAASAASEPAGAAKRRRPLAIWLVISAVAIAGAVAITTMVRDRRMATGPAGPERVMVAAFENRSGDPALNYIGDRAVTSISEGLAQTGLVEIVVLGTDGGRDITASPAGISELLDEAQRMGAGFLVTGSFHATSDSVHIEARLLDVTDGTALNVIPRAVAATENPSGALSRVRSRVMGAMAVRADPTIGEEGSRYAPTYEAYQEYSTGIRLFGADNRQALEHFELAADLDPGFARASVWRMGALHVLSRYAESDSLIENVLRQPGYLASNERLLVDAIAASYRSNMEESLRNLREYARLEPENWWAKRLHGLMAMRLNRPREAIEVFTALAEQGPETDAYVESWTYSSLGSAYHQVGDYELELEITRQGIQTFPDALWFRGREVRALAALGRTDEIAEIMEESKRTPAGDGSVWGIMITAVDELRAHGHAEKGDQMAEEAAEWQRRMMASEGGSERSKRRLAWTLFRARRWEETLASYEELAQLDPDDIDYQGSLGVLAAKTGDRERAVAIKNSFLARDVPYEFGMDIYWAACISAQLGEREEAMDLVRRAFAEGAHIAVHAHQDPDLEPLWDYPPFQRFLEPRD